MGLIMENFRAAVSASRQVPAARVLPRIPVIPGYNDGLEDAAAFADLLNAAGPMNPEALREVQLLPFHQFGQNKYAMLGRDYGFEKTKALHEEDLESYRAVFKDRGIRAF
jgi:pyruvate formate lyase activating enzyme